MNKFVIILLFILILVPNVLNLVKGFIVTRKSIRHSHTIIFLNNKKESRKNFSISSIPGESGWTTYRYGLVHDVYTYGATQDITNIPDWLEEYTFIDYGIYVSDPDEARIKSDLQYYNTKSYYLKVSRECYAYHINTHGLTSLDEPDRALEAADGNWLYPSEIINLWGDYNGGTIYPHGIIVAYACQSLVNEGESVSGSEMAKAFVDYGAEAFVGSTFDVPLSGTMNNDFIDAFWEVAICKWDYSVSDAVSYTVQMLNLNSGDFNYYGNGSYKLPRS